VKAAVQSSVPKAAPAVMQIAVLRAAAEVLEAAGNSVDAAAFISRAEVLSVHNRSFDND